MRQTSLVIAAMLALAGCYRSHGPNLDPCQSDALGTSAIEEVTRLDVLMLIDSSNSMAEEQQVLIRELPTLVEVLATGDFDGDGDNTGPLDFTPVDDLHLGVITPDMGTGGFGGIASCSRADIGQDGVLQNAIVPRRDEAPDCYDGGVRRTLPTFLSFQPTGASPEETAALVTDSGCLLNRGLGGCGFEQQLEAVLKAISPAAPTGGTRPGYRPPTFFLGEGHADGANAGFLRDDARLGILVLTDEDDCSAQDQDLYNPSSGTYGDVDVNRRCDVYADQALHPIARYVDGYLAARTRPGLLTFTAVTGVPPDLTRAPDDPRPPAFDAILRDPRMQYREDGDNPNRLQPACSTPEDGAGFPARRIVSVARGLAAAGAGVAIESICEQSYRDAVLAFVRQLRLGTFSPCLRDALPRNGLGLVDCAVEADLLPGGSCEDLPAWNGERQAGPDGSERCGLRQVAPSVAEVAAGRAPAEAGWFYDDYTAATGACTDGAGVRLALTEAEPPGRVRFACPAFRLVDGELVARIGDGCDPAQPALCRTGTTPSGDGLVCDGVDQRCGFRCTTDDDCRRAGLRGRVCDQTPACQRAPERFGACDTGGDVTPHAFCIDPTCE